MMSSAEVKACIYVAKWIKKVIWDNPKSNLTIPLAAARKTRQPLAAVTARPRGECCNTQPVVGSDIIHKTNDLVTVVNHTFAELQLNRKHIRESKILNVVLCSSICYVGSFF